MCACTVLLLFTHLHNGRNEHGQHGQGKSEDVEKRDGSESSLCSQHIVWVHPDKHCKCGQRNLQRKNERRRNMKMTPQRNVFLNLLCVTKSCFLFSLRLPATSHVSFKISERTRDFRTRVFLEQDLTLLTGQSTLSKYWTNFTCLHLLLCHRNMKK